MLDGDTIEQGVKVPNLCASVNTRKQNGGPVNFKFVGLRSKGVHIISGLQKKMVQKKKKV